jgi:hypothetical protein
MKLRSIAKSLKAACVALKATLKEERIQSAKALLEKQGAQVTFPQKVD